jgi:hypothetical protein
MVGLSGADRSLVRQANGAFMIFTILRRNTFYDCEGNVTRTVNSKSWVATAVVMHQGKVQMDHTNDPNRQFQYLQIDNYRMTDYMCGWKGDYKFEVTVELVPRDQASILLHMDRFPFVPHVPTPADASGPINDEVGREATDRPWKKGADRSHIPRASAKATMIFNACRDPATCKASSSGTAGSMGRSGQSFPIHEVDIWPF